MNMISTIKGSLMESFFPTGWDLERIDKSIGNAPEQVFEKQAFWHKDFQPISCKTPFRF